MTTQYTNLYEITELQQDIVRYISFWVRKENTPISQMEIIKHMQAEGKNKRTVEESIKSLVRLGYIRKAIMRSNKVHFVQLRSI